MKDHDTVNHPKHYTSHPSGVEAIQICEWFGFSIGNAIKYLWRAGLKGDAIEDLRKAAWFVNREINRLQKAAEAESSKPQGGQPPLAVPASQITAEDLVRWAGEDAPRTRNLPWVGHSGHPITSEDVKRALEDDLDASPQPTTPSRSANPSHPDPGNEIP